ncbi:MAG: DUF1573 domain-containing protein [Thermonemataceae bacterium]
MRTGSLLLLFSIIFFNLSAQIDSTQTDKTTQALSARNIITEEARITFTHLKHDFGTVKQGTIVEHTFDFENTGKKSFQILTVQTGCDCTATYWEKGFLALHDKGKVTVKIDTKTLVGEQTKNALVISTAQNKEVVLQLTGKVSP